MASDLVVAVEARRFGIHCLVALARCGGFVEALEGFWPLGTHTYFIDLSVWCFDGLVFGDSVFGYFGVVAFAAVGVLC